MLTDQQVESFQRDGFLNAGQVLGDDEVTRLSDELDRIIDIGPDGFGPGVSKPVLFRDLNSSDDGSSGRNAVWQIVNIWEASALFEQFVFHAFIVNSISRLTGFADLQMWHDQVQYKPAEDAGATFWHQDAPLWPAIEPMTPVSAWIPFDDATEENGCMWMVPGSHR